MLSYSKIFFKVSDWRVVRKSEGWVGKDTEFFSRTEQNKLNCIKTENYSSSKDA